MKTSTVRQLQLPHAGGIKADYRPYPATSSTPIFFFSLPTPPFLCQSCSEAAILCRPTNKPSVCPAIIHPRSSLTCGRRDKSENTCHEPICRRWITWNCHLHSLKWSASCRRGGVYVASGNPQLPVSLTRVPGAQLSSPERKTRVSHATPSPIPSPTPRQMSSRQNNSTINFCVLVIKVRLKTCH